MHRVGLIVPSSNTTMETEIPALLRRHPEWNGEGFTFHSSRARLHTVDVEFCAAWWKTAADAPRRSVMQTLASSPMPVSSL